MNSLTSPVTHFSASINSPKDHKPLISAKHTLFLAFFYLKGRITLLSNQDPFPSPVLNFNPKVSETLVDPYSLFFSLKSSVSFFYWHVITHLAYDVKKKKPCPLALHPLCHSAALWNLANNAHSKSKEILFAKFTVYCFRAWWRAMNTSPHPYLSSTTKQKKEKRMKLTLKTYGFDVTAKCTYKLPMPSGPINLRIFWVFRAGTLNPDFFLTILGGREKESTNPILPQWLVLFIDKLQSGKIPFT